MNLKLTSQAFYRNGTKWRLEDQRGNCEKPVCRLLKPRLSMSSLFGEAMAIDRGTALALSTRDGVKTWHPRGPDRQRDKAANRRARALSDARGPRFSCLARQTGLENARF